MHLVGAPLYHAAPLAGVATPLDSGASVVLMERWTPESFLELVERDRVTHAWMVPTMFNRLLALDDDVRSKADVSSLQAVIHAGAPCAVEVKRRMIEWFGPILNEAYSSTEGAGTLITAEEWLRKPGSVGRPTVAGTVKVFDEDGRECPAGVEGFVYMAPTLWEFEYLHDPEKTAEARRGGLFTVGDIGYFDEEGYLFLCDRVAEVIVSGGVNIYPAEVENVLLGHPLVADAAVVGVPNDEWGEEVRGIVELRTGVPADDTSEATLIALCRSTAGALQVSAGHRLRRKSRTATPTARSASGSFGSPTGPAGTGGYETSDQRDIRLDDGVQSSLSSERGLPRR